jgi:hypothetical protein
MHDTSSIQSAGREIQIQEENGGHVKKLGKRTTVSKEKKRVEEGVAFGRLTAIECVGKTKQYNKLWKFKCSCGNETVRRAADVQKRPNSSCGCLKLEANIKRLTTHGVSRTSEHNTWLGIKERCYNMQHKFFHCYGGRGIKVCKRWLESFENFFADMGMKPSLSHSIDRIDNNGNYAPENCQWRTKKQQANNRSRNIIFTLNGESLNIQQWSEKSGINYAQLYARLTKLNWPIEKAIQPRS